MLGDKYLVVLNFVLVILIWLIDIGGSLMKCGLDLCGGVCFLMEVDMNIVM